jgi:hypothetical protein
MSDSKTVPAGFRENAQGSMVPLSKIKAIDLRRDKMVVSICEQAKVEQARLFGFKATAMDDLAGFVSSSHAEYGVTHGGEKGNVTLTSYDGRYKIQRQMADRIVFDERLQTAKLLIDECLKDFSKGSKDEIKLLVNDAFQVDKAGNVSTGRVLGLRRHKIQDERWLRAMQAIADSMTVADTKPYIRFYERDASGKYQPISLDVAAI